MATATDDVVQQVMTYQRTVAAVRAAVLAVLAASWGSLDDYRDDDIDRWVKEITPILSGGLAQVAAFTDAYLANVVATMTESPAKPAGVRAEEVSVESLRGVPPSEVYRRTGETVWSELSRGADLAAAAAAGLDRATRMAATDLQLARTHTARRVLSGDRRVVGVRRVPRGSSCSLCAVNSTVRYGVEELMPVHVRCQCGVLPVMGTKRGRVLDEELLDALKQSGVSGEVSLQQAASRARKSLRVAEESSDGARIAKASERFAHRQRQLEEYRGQHGTIRTVTVHRHGEIGPVLSDSAHAFTGPNDF